MKRTDSGLFVASNFNFLRRFGRARGRHFTVTLPSGERAKVSVNDARTVKQTEHGNHLDALVCPNPIKLILPARAANGFGRVDGVATPAPVRTGLKIRKAI